MSDEGSSSGEALGMLTSDSNPPYPTRSGYDADIHESKDKDVLARAVHTPLPRRSASPPMFVVGSSGRASVHDNVVATPVSDGTTTPDNASVLPTLPPFALGSFDRYESSRNFHTHTAYPAPPPFIPPVARPWPVDPRAIETRFLPPPFPPLRHVPPPWSVPPPVGRPGSAPPAIEGRVTPPGIPHSPLMRPVRGYPRPYIPDYTPPSPQLPLPIPGPPLPYAAYSPPSLPRPPIPYPVYSPSLPPIPPSPLPPSPLPFVSSPILQSLDRVPEALDPTSRALADYLIKGFRTLQAEGSNGWNEVAELQNSEEEKLNRCKADIDIFLIFVGLFSVVLAAFVVQSYRSLSPGPNDKMEQLLSQIALQTSSYIIASSFVNATTPPLTFQPFEPSVTDLRVNRLWFASLVLSLIAASLGILIKQWLSAYKSVDPQFSSMRSRLRIQHFRYLGLIKWKVFELADFLPLLIQLALGLFLMGLCFFTWSFDDSVGRSCTVLVAAWAFFFLAATFAPIIASGCPWKISLLSPILRALRTRLHHISFLQWLYVGPKVAQYQRPPFDVVALKRFSAAVGSIIRYISRAPLALRRAEASSRNQEGEVNSKPGALGRSGNKSSTRSRQDLAESAQSHSIRSVPLEENEVAQDRARDFDILRPIILNNELSKPAVRALFSQTQCTPEEVMKFVVQVLRLELPQLGTDFGQGRLPMVNLRALSSQTWGNVVEITCNALQQHSMTPEKEETEPWIHDAFAILASRVNDPIIHAHISTAPFSSYHPRLLAVSPGALAGIPFQDIWEYLRWLSPQSFSLEEMPNLVLRIHQGLYCRPQCRHDSLLDQARSHCPSWADQKAVYGIVNDLLRRSSSMGMLPSRDSANLLCAAISWAACSCHGYADSPRSAFLEQFFHVIATVNEEFLKDFVTEALAEEFSGLFGSVSFSLSSLMRHHYEFGHERIVHIFIYTLHRCAYISDTGSIPATSCYELHRQTWSMLQTYDPEGLFPEDVHQLYSEDWSIVLYLLRDVTKRAFTQGAVLKTSQEELHSALARKILRLWSGGSIQDIITKFSLQPLWNTMMETLHIFVLHDGTPPLCRRGTTSTTFKEETIDKMASHGWRTTNVNIDAADFDSGEPTATYDERNVKENLGRILSRFGGNGPDDEESEEASTSPREEVTERTPDIQLGLVKRAKRRLRFWFATSGRSDPYGSSDNVIGESPADGMALVHPPPRTCAEIEKRRTDVDSGSVRGK